MLVQDLPAFFGHVATPAVVGTSRGTEIAELDDTEPEDSDDDEEFATRSRLWRQAAASVWATRR